MDPLTRVPTLRSSQVHRDLAILVVAVALCAAPFLSQPFHMDDNFYLDMARNVPQTPLFPHDRPYVFDGQYVQDMGSHSHPPLQTYFLALVRTWAADGAGNEWIYHACAAIFPLIAVLALYFVAAFFLERPLWPALVLACSPLFQVMQHNVMTDIPTLAFWLAAVAAFLWANESGGIFLYTASAVLQCAAMFTSYQAMALAPLLAFYQLRRRGRPAGWLCLIVPPVLMAAWLVMNYFHYRRFLLTDTIGYVSSRHAGSLAALQTKVAAILGYQGWLIIFPLFLLYIFGRGLKGRLLCLTALLAACAAQLLVPQYRLTDKAIFVIGAVTGLFIVARMAIWGGRAFIGGQSTTGLDAVGAQFISLWYFGVLCYCLILFTEGSARYILPLIPPVVICFFRRLEILEVSEYRRSDPPLFSAAMVASGSLVLTLAWGLLLSHADLEFARIYPRAAHDFLRIAGTSRAYFVGEWGLRHYFTQAGAAMLPLDESSVTGGSFVATPRLALPRDLPADLRSMTMPLQTLTYDVATPLRMLASDVPAGFYSTGWGWLPFSISRKNLEEIEIRQVNYLVERLPWAKAETTSTVLPWPGYMEIQSKSLLALLAKPGSRISYPWLETEPKSLDVRCGIDPRSYEEGSTASYKFVIRQFGQKGSHLVSSAITLKPGLRRDDRAWQPMKLMLQGSGAETQTLELSFECEGGQTGATGAFAEAVLRPRY
jgi:hypothetical protein